MHFSRWNKLTVNRKYTEGFLYALQAIFVLGIAFISLGLDHYDLHIPFSYSGDTVVILMFINSTLLVFDEP
jgi:hypothetical protein